MIIEEADFRMESVGDNLHFWDLSILKTIKSKDGERQEFKVIGYGLPISACLQRIADYRIECKHPDAMSLKPTRPVCRRVCSPMPRLSLS